MKAKEKVVKKLEEIVLPFRFTPSVPITGGVNKFNYDLQAGKEVEISFPVYEAILNSSYANELKD